MSNPAGDRASSGAEEGSGVLAHVHSIVDTVREPLLVLDGDLRVQSANRSFYRNFRVSPQETEGQLLYDLGNGQWNIPGLRILLEEILPHDNSFDDFEVEHDFPDIGRKVMLLNARRLRQEGAERILLAIEDVTERRRLEAERREIETRFTSLVKNIKDHSIFTLDPEGRVTSWNVAAEHILGHAEAEALGRHFSFIFTPEDREHGVPEAELRVAREQGRAEDERWHLRKGGERFWALGIVSALHEPDGRLIGFSKILRDMTDWKRSEEAAVAADALARQRLAELEDVYQNAPVGLCMLDRDLRFLRINERLAEINGIPAAEHLGKTVGEVLPMLADTLEPSLRGVVDTGQARLNIEVVGETHARPGVRRTWVEHWLPVRDAAGKAVGVSIVVEEITERKHAEMALRESDRRKDEFLAILAHELRNPLTPIRIGLDLMQALRGDPAASEEPLRIMDRQVSHLVRLIDDLLDVSRISRGKIQLRKERLELAEIIDAALDMSESSAGGGDRHVRVSVPSHPLPVDGDRVRLVQIIGNLLSNAAKFTDVGGHIDLLVARAGDRVEIRVRDDGRGIPPERLGDIFEMFSQAEPGYGAGLGIGLSLVRGLVEMHGGTVCAESEGAGCGATFTVSLPLCLGATSQPLPDKANDFDALQTECRVLVVDDNRDIAKGLHLLLTTLGAEVRVALDGAEALRIFDDWPATHVLMDLGMPGMDGYEAARRLRAQHPERLFRLIAVTGWGQEENRQRAREAGFDEHLVKPVRVLDLKAVLS